MKIKVIRPASAIPLYSTVTKRTGEKEYTLRDSILIYSRESADTKEIKADVGTLLMCAPDGCATAISSETELCWVTDRETLVRTLTEETETR